MDILVTGGCGYIGSALALHLRSIGHHVTSIDIAGPADMVCDYRHQGSLFYERFEAVIHLAGHSSVWMADADPWAATGNNLMGLIKMLPKLRGIPLLWASSGSVLSPVASSIYDATKRSAEAIVPILYPNSYALRFGTVCGVSPRMRWDLMLNKMSADAMSDGIVRVSNPSVSRPVLAMRDLCAAVTALLHGNLPGAFNLVTGNDTVEGFASAVAKRFSAEMRLGENAPTYDFTMSRTHIIGFEPSQTVDMILADLEQQMAQYA